MKKIILMTVVILALITLIGCAKEQKPVLVSISKTTLQEGDFEKILKEFKFTPNNQPLNREDLASVTQIVMQCQEVAKSMNVQHAEINRSWDIFKVIDVTLKDNPSWKEYMEETKDGKPIYTDRVGKILFEAVNK